MGASEPDKSWPIAMQPTSRLTCSSRGQQKRPLRILHSRDFATLAMWSLGARSIIETAHSLMVFLQCKIQSLNKPAAVFSINWRRENLFGICFRRRRRKSCGRISTLQFQINFNLTFHQSFRWLCILETSNHPWKRRRKRKYDQGFKTKSCSCSKEA